MKELNGGRESLAAVRRLNTPGSGRCNRVVVEDADRDMHM